MTTRFDWHEIVTTDPEKAKTFYTELFGWSVTPMEMGEHGIYNSISCGELGIGGIMPLDSSLGNQSHWMNYLLNQDIDATVAKITALGGSIIVPPFEVAGVGHIAVVSDPQGAVFTVFQDSNPNTDPQPPGPPQKGGVAWHELLTTNPSAAASFYSSLGGLTHSVQDMDTGPYTLLMDGDIFVAGIMNLADGMTTPAWMVYFEIAQDSMDEALAEVTRLGGHVGMGPMDIPTVGAIGAAADPTGGWFLLMKSAPPRA